MKARSIVLLSTALLSANLFAQDVYHWKGSSGSNAYSDIPANLRPSENTLINTRTKAVVLPTSADSSGKRTRSQDPDIERACAKARRDYDKIQSARPYLNPVLMAAFDKSYEENCR